MDILTHDELKAAIAEINPADYFGGLVKQEDRDAAVGRVVEAKLLTKIRSAGPVVHEISGRTADELWAETGRLRAQLADILTKLRSVEPVAELVADMKGGGSVKWLSEEVFEPGTLLYTHPYVQSELDEAAARGREIAAGLKLYTHPAPSEGDRRDAEAIRALREIVGGIRLYGAPDKDLLADRIDRRLDEVSALLIGCVEHMEHSTPQGKKAHDDVRAAMSKGQGNGG